MYLKYINNDQIDTFVKNIFCPNARNIIVDDGEERNFVKVYNNLLSTTLHITDFECVNIATGRIYSKIWRKYMVEELDTIDKHLGDRYIDSLHDHLEQDTICGPIL